MKRTALHITSPTIPWESRQLKAQRKLQISIDTTLPPAPWPWALAHAQWHAVTSLSSGCFFFQCHPMSHAMCSPWLVIGIQVVVYVLRFSGGNFTRRLAAWAMATCVTCPGHSILNCPKSCCPSEPEKPDRTPSNQDTKSTQDLVESYFYTFWGQPIQFVVRECQGLSILG